MTDKDKAPMPTYLTSWERKRQAYLMHDPFVAGLCRRILELEDEVKNLQDRIDDDYR